MGVLWQGVVGVAGVDGVPVAGGRGSGGHAAALLLGRPCRSALVTDLAGRRQREGRAVTAVGVLGHCLGRNVRVAAGRESSSGRAVGLSGWH